MASSTGATEFLILELFCLPKQPGHVAQMAQTVKSMLSNVPYMPTVYKTGTKTKAQPSTEDFFFQKIFRVIAVSKSGPRFQRPLSLNKKRGLCMQNEFTNGMQP